MISVFEQKQNLRKIFKEKRSTLSQQEIADKSKQVNQNFIDNLLEKIYPKNSQKIFSLYFSSYGEVSTDLIAQHFYQNQIRFSYPKIVQKNHHLDFVLAKHNQGLEPNIFFPKILEPQNGVKVLPNLVILPLLAFDANLSRLGMGGGFFDRTIEFLKKQNSEIITIALAYDFQRLETLLPIDNTDQKLDFIATKTKIFSAS